MKKIIFALLALPLLLLTGCAKEPELVFEHEKPQFETREDAVLLEVIVPTTTPELDEVYIAGPFNGLDENTVLGVDKWKLTRSAKTRHVWGVYVKPGDFAAGKTLADGYYFVSLARGPEVNSDGEAVQHTKSASAGERIMGLKVAHWEADLLPPPDVDWPAVPAGMIQLRLTLPDYTPVGYPVLASGDFNGWNTTDPAYVTTTVDNIHHYLNIDPAMFTDGKSLADMFKLALSVPGQEWWYHESNEDGSADGGAGFTIANAITGRAYELTIREWRNKADLPAGIPTPSADKFMLLITIPDYTPENSLIGIFGEWNGWGAMLGDPTPWTATMFSPTTYYLMVDPALIAEGKTLADMFHITLYYDTSTDGNWWKHQANLDGGGDEGPGINNTANPASPIYTFAPGNTYNITVQEWRNSDDIKGVDPGDLSVAPWPGLTVDAGKILLQIEVPGYTPDNSSIALCGTVSGWAGDTQLDKFGATQYSAGRYYIQLDPADFAADSSLGDEFKFGLLETGQEWWQHESNALKVPGAETDKAYTVYVTEWARAESIPGVISYPPIPADKVVIHLFVPSTTPADATIALYGDVNGWNGADLAKWGATKVNATRYVLELDPADFADGTGLTKETTDNGFSFAVIVAGQEWYYHQNEDGNMLLNGEESGKAYNATVTAWKNDSEL